MKAIKMMKKILILLMIFVFLTVNYCHAETFYYSGTQKGTYNAKESIWAKIINGLADIADYIIGLATWGQRMFLVGWTAIAELALNDTLEAATGDSPGFELSAATLDMTDSNDQRKVTVENIVFNKIPILDVNFFETEVDDTVTGTGAVKTQLIKQNKNGKVETSSSDAISATGVETKDGEIVKDDVLEEPTESVIVIIKNTIAKWYYAMRSFAVGTMLLVLLYIALRLIVAVVGEQKAKYKQMLYNWVVGFAVVFCIHYIMLFVIMVNEELVSTFNQMSVKYMEKEYKTAEDKTNTEMELSLYTSLRSRAYEVKASRGWIGTVLYMVLVYYAVRFTLVYLKRYFTVMILAMMAPVLSATYAFGKVRTGKAESFNKWLKEFIFAVLLQAVHALIYVTLITQILRMTETSIIGAVLAFLVLNFMLKADGIVKRIFNMSTGQHSALDNILGTPGSVAQSIMGLRAGAQMAKMYGRYWLKPVYGGIGKAVGAGLSIPGNAILGATGGIIAARNANQMMNDGVAKPKKGEESGERRLDENGNPIGRNTNDSVTNRNRGAAYRGYDPIYGGFNPNHFSTKAAERAARLNAERKAQGKSEKEYKWSTRGAKMFDVLKAQSLGKINKALYRQGLVEDPKLVRGTNEQIEQKLAQIRENNKKLQREQIQKFLTLSGGIALSTIGIPLLVANPKFGISLLANGYSMQQKVVKYDKKGKINKKSLRLQKTTTIEYETDENGKQVKKEKTRYQVTGLMTSMGTFVKKGTGIAWVEGLTTNMGDDIDKVMKQNKKDIKELEMLYNVRNKLYDLEIMKQERILQHELFMADPQQAFRREKYRDSIADGTFSVYAGRVMQTNEEMSAFMQREDVKKFMQESGIGKTETLIAMNALMKVAMDNNETDITKMTFNVGTYQQLMEKVHEDMSLMGLNDTSDEATKARIKEKGLTDADIRAERLDDIDQAMTALKAIMDQNPEETKKLMQVLAVQEATAQALNNEEERRTEMLREAGVFEIAAEQKSIVIEQDELERTKKEIDEKLEKSSKQQQQAIDEFNEAENAMKKAEEELAEMKEKFEQLEEDEKKAKQAEYDLELSKKEEELREIGEKFADKKIKFEESVEQFKQIQEEKLQLEERKEDLEQKQKDLNSKLESAITEVFAEEGLIQGEKQVSIKESKEQLQEAQRDVERKKAEIEIAKNDPNATEKKKKELEKQLADLEDVVKEKEGILADARYEALKDTEAQDLVARAVEDAESIGMGGKTKIEVQDAKTVTTEEIVKALAETGGYETLLEIERNDKPTECQKTEKKQIDIIETGDVIEVEVKVEDLEARKANITELVEAIKIEEKVSSGVDDTKEVSNGGKSAKDWVEFSKELEERRRKVEQEDPIEQIAAEIEKTIEDTKSKSQVAGILQDRDELNKENDVRKMTDDDFREIYKSANQSEYASEINENEREEKVATGRDLDILKSKVKDKLTRNMSEKDKSKLRVLLDKINGEVSITDYNKMVAEYNQMNEVAEEAFIREMKDETSASHVEHNDDFVTTSADKLRRGLNSEAVRSSKGETEVQSKVAELLRANDYAQFETVKVKSSGRSGKKMEKGPIVSVSDIIKNLV